MSRERIFPRTPEERLASEMRRRKRIDDGIARAANMTAWNMAPVRVLVPWHDDEQGNRSRTVGAE